jgi:hypothetical protein
MKGIAQVLTFFVFMLVIITSCTPSVVKCSNDDDCLYGEHCIQSICESSSGKCSSDSDCPVGSECSSLLLCVKITPKPPECVRDSDCLLPNQICKNEECVTKPLEEGDSCTSFSAKCSSGLICSDSSDGKCVRLCDSSRLCDSQKFCYPAPNDKDKSVCLEDQGAPIDYIYKIQVVSAKVSEKDPNGSGWDPFGGLPDMKVLIRIGGKDYETAEKPDSSFATWNYTISSSFTAEEISKMEVTLIDVDVASDDPIVTLKGFSITKAKGNTFDESSSKYGLISLKIEINGTPK